MLQDMSKQQLINYFALYRWTEKEILSPPLLYMSDNYVSLVKQLPEYPAYVKKYSEKYSTYNSMQKVWGYITRTYQPNLAKRFIELYNKCQEEKKSLEQKEIECLTAEHRKAQEAKKRQYETYQQKLVTLELQLQLQNCEYEYGHARLNALHYTIANNEYNKKNNTSR